MGAARILPLATTVNTRRSPIRTTTGCTSHLYSVLSVGAITAFRTRIRRLLTMLGEFFFSSPINNFNIWQDYGRSDDDQRHRVVFDGTIHAPTGASNTIREHLTHGFQLTAMLQYYSPLPFNITTGANTIQGTTARPTIDGAYINRNAGSGFDFFNLSARSEPQFPVDGAAPAGGDRRGIQPDESSKWSDFKRRLRNGNVSYESLTQLQTDHSRWRPASVPICAADSVLKGDIYAFISCCGFAHFDCSCADSRANRQPQVAAAPGLTALVFGER